jgi:predicted enzyme related to lactoylglutathione lyase
MRCDSNRLVHLELHTCELDGARSFCRALFGWRGERVETRFGSYEALELGGAGSGALGGGIVQCPTERALWLPYVEVGDLRQVTESARLLGASVMLEPREGPLGWRSVIATHAAGEIALWQPKR